MRIKTIIDSLEKLPKPFLTFVGFLLVLAIGSLDSLTSYDISVSVLYLLPIALIAWFEGGVPAAIISIFSAITWAVSDLASGHIYSSVAAPIWNSLVVLAMFFTVTFSLVTFKKLLQKEREHAHTDELTGATNFKFFYEQAGVEIRKAALQKQPLTLASINLDNLKQINDTFGHLAGDFILHEVSHIMKSTARSTDIISRLGGARFAILMPGTGDKNAADIISKVQEHLLDMVKKSGWPVTFSTGVVTCEGPGCTIDELIKRAEDLMNAAREAGSNTVKFKMVDSSSSAVPQ
jgi:diguanylate cyclase (GGDEF)-like protein